jgi:UDP-N-acetylglucosamine:LPS N-acetylglucosamine transferase
MHLQPSNSLKIVPFTEEIPDFMKASDLIITKPGPGTLNEVIEMKVPILIDETKTSLFWEKINIELIKQLGVGQSIQHLDDLSSVLNMYFDPFVREKMHRAFMNIPSNQFSLRIPGIVGSLCDSHWMADAKVSN